MIRVCFENYKRRKIFGENWHLTHFYKNDKTSYIWILIKALYYLNKSNIPSLRNLHVRKLMKYCSSRSSYIPSLYFYVLLVWNWKILYYAYLVCLYLHDLFKKKPFVSIVYSYNGYRKRQYSDGSGCILSSRCDVPKRGDLCKNLYRRRF